MLSPPKLRRKRHRNSRLGCDTCKRRKVKCLEDLPQCKNCVRHKVKCDYLTKLPLELALLKKKVMVESLAKVAALMASPLPATPPDYPRHMPPPLPSYMGLPEGVPPHHQLFPQIYHMNPMTSFGLMPLGTPFSSFGSAIRPPPLKPAMIGRYTPTNVSRLVHTNVAIVNEEFPFFASVLEKAYTGDSAAFMAVIELSRYFLSTLTELKLN